MGALRPVARDAPLVAALRETGALLLGKTAMVEHGLSAMGLNTAAGTPRNPYNPNHLTGGSSSGSAAAVAAGLCPFAIGARPWPARLARAPGLRAPSPAQAGHARSRVQVSAYQRGLHPLLCNSVGQGRAAQPPRTALPARPPSSAPPPASACRPAPCISGSAAPRLTARASLPAPAPL